MKQRTLEPFLYDPGVAMRARDAAVEQVARGKREWIERALFAIRQAGRQYGEFSTDDVWPFLDEIPAEPRALGAAMTRARKEGMIEPTQEYIESQRVVCHRRPLRIWRYVGAP